MREIGKLTRAGGEFRRYVSLNDFTVEVQKWLQK